MRIPCVDGIDLWCNGLEDLNPLGRQMDSDKPKPLSEHEIRGSSKQPYQKPAFRHEKVFETMALACGKISGTQSQCRFNRKNS